MPAAFGSSPADLPRPLIVTVLPEPVCRRRTRHPHAHAHARTRQHTGCTRILPLTHMDAERDAAIGMLMMASTFHWWEWL
eukprot:2651465-Pleurochrysis_carterae.AAC.2